MTETDWDDIEPVVTFDRICDDGVSSLKLMVAIDGTTRVSFMDTERTLVVEVVQDRLDYAEHAVLEVFGGRIEGLRWTLGELGAVPPWWKRVMNRDLVIVKLKREVRPSWGEMARVYALTDLMAREGGW